MKLWQAEYDAFEFAKTRHTLKEWADYGFNRVQITGTQRIFYDGGEWVEGGVLKIDDDDKYELDFWDFDDDGYRIVFIRKEEK